MISDSLLKSAVAGRDGFTWWVGRVSPASVWKNRNVALIQNGMMSQRVKVRIVGYHPFDDTITEEDLPWAHVMSSPVTGSGQGMMGDTLCLVGGETCIGFFMDGEEAQQPVIMGLLHRHDNTPDEIKESEIDSQRSTHLKSHTGHDEGVKSTKSPKDFTLPISKVNPTVTGQVIPAGTDEHKLVQDLANEKVFYKVNEDGTQSGIVMSDFLTTSEDGGGTTGGNSTSIGVVSESEDAPSGTQNRILTSLEMEDGVVSSRSKGSGSGGSSSKSSSPNGTAMKKGGPSKSDSQSDKKTDVGYQAPSNCRDDAVGKMSHLVQDFIGFTNGLENAAGVYIDPVLNKIVDMDAELKRTASGIASVMNMTTNNIRAGLTSKIITSFEKFAAEQIKIDPKNFLNGPRLKKATQGVAGLLFCAFKEVGKSIGDFVKNMLKGLLGKVINAPFCAAEQFVSGLLSKVMNMIENVTGPILSGISWLTGGIQNVKKVLSNASNLAGRIVNFLNSCDKTPCDNPRRWKASKGLLGADKSGGFKKALDNVDIFGGIQKKLGDAQKYLGGFNLAKDIAGGNLSNLKGAAIDSSGITGILDTVNTLTGGASSKWELGGLGTIESAIATSSLFGNGGSIFGDCNNKTDDPQDQDDIIPMPPGFTYERCFPPKIEVAGRGSGAILTASISKTDNSIFSIDVVDGGMGYDDQTSISIIDNTNHGSGAVSEPVIENGSITGVIVLSGGSGYCGATEPVGIVTAVHPVNPGLGYTSGDTVSIIDDEVTIEASVVVTPNGSIVKVVLPDTSPIPTDPTTTPTDPTTPTAPTITPTDPTTPTTPISPTTSTHQYTSTPRLRINTTTGYGANFVPVMKNIQLTATDSAIRPLVGITSVIDCPTEDHRGM